MKEDGRGSFDSVVRAWRLLRRHGVDVNILCAVHAANVERPREVYRFFRDELRAEFLQFIPIVERDGNGTVTPRTVDPERFGRFLIAVFDEWLRRDIGKVFVQTFDAVLGNWLGAPSLCIFSQDCSAHPVLEHNGDLYSCDHFVDPEHRLGNIVEREMGGMISSDRQRAFGASKLATLPRSCRECEVLFACQGECPRNRFARGADGEEGMNYLCAGYKAFFAHVARPMRIMAELLRAGRPASEVTAYYPAPRAGVVSVFDVTAGLPRENPKSGGLADDTNRSRGGGAAAQPRSTTVDRSLVCSPRRTPAAKENLHARHARSPFVLTTR